MESMWVCAKALSVTVVTVLIALILILTVVEYEPDIRTGYFAASHRLDEISNEVSMTPSNEID